MMKAKSRYMGISTTGRPRWEALLRQMPYPPECKVLVLMAGQTRYACYTGGDTDFSKALSSTNGWDVTTYPCSPGNDQSSNNASGFSAYPAGYCYEGTIFAFGYNTLFWCATDNAIFGWVCGKPYTYWTYYENDSAGLSVRCVKD